MLVVLPEPSLLGRVRRGKRVARWGTLVVCSLAVLTIVLMGGTAAAMMVIGDLLGAGACLATVLMAGVVAFFAGVGSPGLLGHYHMTNPIDCAGYVQDSNANAMRRLFEREGPVEPVTGADAYAYAHLHHQVVLCERYLAQLRVDMAKLRGECYAADAGVMASKGGAPGGS